MRRLLAVAALCLATPVSAASVEDGQAWINLTAMGAIRGDLIFFAEVQPRLYDGASRLGQLIVRPAIGWKISDAVSVYQGYAHVEYPIEGGPDLHEERPFQQVNWTMGKIGRGTLCSRTRLEERWRGDDPGVKLRLREMLRCVHPIGDPKRIRALVSEEGFVALNGEQFGNEAGFDQLRSFAGFEIPLPGKSTIELGYLNQFTDSVGGRTAMNHVASLAFFFRL